MSGPLRVALVGHGRWGKNVARVLSRLPDCELAVVCDARADELARFAGRAGTRTTRRFEDVLADPSVQACALCTPSGLHVEHSMAALGAAKHVFVEKPMALSQHDAHAVGMAVEASGRRLMVGHIVLFHPAFRELTRLVHGGELGKIQRVITLRGAAPRQGSQEDPWWALACHDVSVITALLPAPATAIRGDRRAGSDHQESVHAELDFADGSSASITVSRGAERVRRVLVIGEAGSACFRDEAPPGRVEIYPPGAVEDWTGGGSPSRRPLRSLPIPAAEPLELELGHFVQGVLRHRPLLTDHAHGARVTEILDAGQRAIQAGRELSVALPERAPISERESA